MQSAARPVAGPVDDPPAHLLERSHQISLLEQALDGVSRTGQGRLVLISGEAGVGKTSLLRAFRGRREASTRMLWGGCDPLFTPRPLGPLLAVADATEGELEKVVSSGAPAHDVVSSLVGEFRSRPTVLVLEDVHWADEATLDVLRLLARRLEAVPSLVIATFRDDELDRKHPLRLIIGELATSPAVTRIKLPPLTREAVNSLARPRGVDPEELYRRTAGNPFFVVEVLASDTDDIPETVKEAVHARAARLSPNAQLVLDAIAVVPVQAELWLVTALAGDSIGALGECLSSGLLIAESGAVAFRHDLARLAILDSIAPDRAVTLHRKAIAALASPPVGDLDFARLAHHAEAAGDPDAVVRYAIPAAEVAATHGAHREAAAQYARALRFGARLDPAERITLLQRRAEECLVTDQYDEGIANLEEAVGISRKIGDRLQEGGSLCKLSEFLWCPGRVRESDRAAVESVRILRQLAPGRELGYAYLNLAFVRARGARANEAVEWAQRAQAVAADAGDMEAAIIAGTRIAEAQKDETGLLSVVARAQTAGLEQHAAMTYQYLGDLALSSRRLDAATRYLEDGLAIASSRGFELDRLYLLQSRARVELARGAWAAAAETAAAVIRIPRTSTTPRINALVVLGLIRARRGDPGSDEALNEAWALAEPTGELLRKGHAAAALAELAWLKGDADGVDRWTRAVLGEAVERGVGGLAAQLAIMRSRTGLAPDPSFRAQGAGPYARELAGDPRGAAVQWRELGFPYETALAFMVAGDEQSMRQALDELQRLEAKAVAAIAARRLRERGVRSIPRGPRASTMQNPAGLTERELEVLRLVAEGQTNNEIAARLVLSERTVDHHVSAILGKLDARSRREAADAANRMGLTSER